MERRNTGNKESQTRVIIMIWSRNGNLNKSVAVEMEAEI